MTDPRRERIQNDPGFLPEIAETEAREANIDTDDPRLRGVMRDLLLVDPDLFGDWDPEE